MTHPTHQWREDRGYTVCKRCGCAPDYPMATAACVTSGAVVDPLTPRRIREAKRIANLRSATGKTVVGLNLAEWCREVGVSPERARKAVTAKGGA